MIATALNIPGIKITTPLYRIPGVHDSVRKRAYNIIYRTAGFPSLPLRVLYIIFVT